MANNFSEKRKAPRFSLEAFSDFKNENGEMEKDCYIQNIGTGGVMAMSILKHSVGDKIKISFKIKDRTFEKEGVVRTSKPLSSNRKHLLKIGKNLNFATSLNIAFNEELSLADFDYIKFNYLKD